MYYYMKITPFKFILNKHNQTVILLFVPTMTLPPNFFIIIK